VRRAVVTLALLMLAGCAPERWSYTRAGVSPGRLDQDLEACRRQAHRPYRFAFVRSARVDQDALNLCMQQKGYAARRDD
jgi:hypothetical protein